MFGNTSKNKILINYDNIGENKGVHIGELNALEENEPITGL
jgi:hypothetical protein